MSLLKLRILTQKCKLNGNNFKINYFNTLSNENTKSLISQQTAEEIATSPKKISIENGLRSAFKIDDVYEIFRKYSNDMSKSHLNNSLKAIYSIKMHQELPTEDIINNPEFKELCYRIKSQIRYMSLGQHINILNILAELQIRKDSTIVQVVLKMILHQVNDLTIEQSVFLTYKMRLLQKQEIGEDTPLFKTLYSALFYNKKIKENEMKDPVMKAIQTDYPMLRLRRNKIIRRK